ncbi:hypothetical protein GCM10023186_23480 [Hymenobacter koreensis]|uniref:Uncharacterized protein n=1 Tax=Hymenobacter koreensis TaxID=1084523 RepID=A0ABP8J0Q3_9BACT
MVSSTVSAQKIINVEIEKDRKENFWRSYVLDLEKKIQLRDVAVSPAPFCLRLWLSGQVVDIWQEKDGLRGSLVNWVKEVVPYGEDETNRYFIIKEELDASICEKIHQAYVERQLETLPSEERIAGWKGGFDGVIYILETSRANKYYLKSYWTPKAQGSLEEAAVVQSFVNDVAQVLALPARRHYFSNSIPFASWSNDGSFVTSRINTSAEYFRLKQERNRFRRSVKRQMLNQQQP